MRLELSMARRLSLRAPGIPVAVAGISLSVAVMLMSIAIVGGFKQQIREKVTGFEHQLTIYPTAAYPGSPSGIVLDARLRGVIDSLAPGSSVTLGLRQPGLLKTDDDFEGMVFSGIPPQGESFISSQLVQGEMPSDSLSGGATPVVVSTATASALKLDVGDKVTAHFFIGENLYSRRLLVSGLYDTHFGDYDKSYVFAPLAMLQKLCGVGEDTGGCVNIDGVAGDADGTATDLRVALSPPDGSFSAPGFRVESATSGGALYFAWLDLLDTNVLVILILMGCVAGFTLVSCLFIIVLERVRMIGLLKALGATDGMVRRLFIAMATRLVARGLLIGNAVGLTLLWIQHQWHPVPLDPAAYYLSSVPVRFDWAAIAALDAAVVVLSLLLLIVPSHIISTLSPSETMRYD